MGFDLLFQFFVLNTLNKVDITRSSYCFWSFFLFSFLGAESDIFKNNSNNKQFEIHLDIREHYYNR
jgi:hypothetical protein